MARDLVRGGDPVRVSERTATETLTRWERIGARLVPWKKEIVLAGGMLQYSFDAAEALRKTIKGSLRRVRGKASNLAEQLGASDPAALLERFPTACC